MPGEGEAREGESLSEENRWREGEVFRLKENGGGSKKLPGQKHTTGGLTLSGYLIRPNNRKAGAG